VDNYVCSVGQSVIEYAPGGRKWEVRNKEKLALANFYLKAKFT